MPVYQCLYDEAQKQHAATQRRTPWTAVISPMQTHVASHILTCFRAQSLQTNGERLEGGRPDQEPLLRDGAVPGRQIIRIRILISCRLDPGHLS